MKPVIRFSLISAIAFAFALWLTGQGLAQDAKNSSVNPTASSVKEDQLFRELDRVTGRISIPDQKAATLEQPEGREWRQLHQTTIPKYGAYVLLGMLAVIILFYLLRGRITLERGWSGIKVLRFNSFERFVHWFTATCFVILGLTGLNVVFGRALILPYIGEQNFAAMTQYGKYLHNFLGIPFALGILAMYLMWLWDNLPSTTDLRWIASGGGLFGKRHAPPSKKFNFGQKVIFWSVILIGGAISITGFLLLFPFYGTGISQMQGAQLIHSIGAIILVAIIFAHIYIGTLGMEGAFEAMGSGTVDLNWAREHHSLWAEHAQVVDDHQKAPSSGAPMPAE